MYSFKTPHNVTAGDFVAVYQDGSLGFYDATTEGQLLGVAVSDSEVRVNGEETVNFEYKVTLK